MLEIRTSGSMSGEGKRSDAVWPKLPRLSSTLPSRGATKMRAASWRNFAAVVAQWPLHLGSRQRVEARIGPIRDTSYTISNQHVGKKICIKPFECLALEA